MAAGFGTAVGSVEVVVGCGAEVDAEVGAAVEVGAGAVVGVAAGSVVGAVVVGVDVGLGVGDGVGLIVDIGVVVDMGVIVGVGLVVGVGFVSAETSMLPTTIAASKVLSPIAPEANVESVVDNSRTSLTYKESVLP